MWATNQFQVLFNVYNITLAASSLPSSTGVSALALVEVFDVALVDGALAPISHSIEVVEVDAMSATEGGWRRKTLDKRLQAAREDGL
jgi:hypothetical protein